MNKNETSVYARKVMRVDLKILIFGLALSPIWNSLASEDAKSGLIDESFEGNAGEAPHPLQWGVTGGHASVDGDGQIVFDTSSGYGHQALLSNRAERQTNEFSLSVTFENLNGTALWNMTLGLVEDDSSLPKNYILVRTDIGNDHWTVDICADGQRSYKATTVSRTVLGTWTVEWRQDQVLVYLDGTLQFDSKIDPPELGEGWRLPECELRPYIGGSGGQIMKLDRLIMKKVEAGVDP